MWQTIKDWFWWKFVINENEFHPKLEIDTLAILEGKTTLEKEQKRILPLRERAHKLDQRWG